MRYELNQVVRNTTSGEQGVTKDAQETSIAHVGDPQAQSFYPGGVAYWRPDCPPNLETGPTVGVLRSCSYCGSMHPADVAAAIRAGAKGDWADFKYGWPHKAYFDNVPNPHAGLLETRSSACVKSEQYPNEVRERRYDPRTGERVEDYVRYTEVPEPARATTSGKFYTVHLRDATIDDRETIERHLGLRFTFSGDRVSWEPVADTATEGGAV